MYLLLENQIYSFKDLGFQTKFLCYCFLLKFPKKNIRSKIIIIHIHTSFFQEPIYTIKINFFRVPQLNCNSNMM